jgi:hypothetical protein
VERRYISFIAISLAAILAGQALQAWLYPPRPKADKAAVERAGGAAEAAVRPQPEGDALQVKDRPAAADAEPMITAPAPRARRTLGSLDPSDPARMLVTLTSRGAAVERIEL